MGRGARSKKKRRFRSLSPNGRDTPDGQAGYGGGAALTDEYVVLSIASDMFEFYETLLTHTPIYSERRAWRCSHCLVWGPAVWAVRDGPNGAKVSLLCYLNFRNDSTRSLRDLLLTTLTSRQNRHSATTAAFSSNVTRTCRRGPRTILHTKCIRVRRRRCDDDMMAWLNRNVGFDLVQRVS